MYSYADVRVVMVANRFAKFRKISQVEFVAAEPSDATLLKPYLNKANIAE